MAATEDTIPRSSLAAAPAQLTTTEQAAPEVDKSARSSSSSAVQQPEPASPVASDAAASGANSKSGVEKSWLVRHFFAFAASYGCGLLASVSYLDPGNLEADIQLGVSSGMSLLWWTAVCCLVFGFLFQCLAGRVGLVSGKDLAQHLGERYPRPARWAIWVIIEIAIIGADIQETVGSALAISILTSGRVPLWAGCIIVSITAFSLLLLERIGFRQLEALFACFIAIEAVCMGINFFQAPIAAEEVARGIFVPKLTAETVVVAAAALGALVMPYNVFFQSAIVNARPRDVGTDAKKRTMLTYMRIENFMVLTAAFVINMFVICVFADSFYGTLDPDEVGLASAGDFLGERFGSTYRTVWAIGLLASGQVATIALTYAGQLVMSGLLNMQVQAGPRMLATRLVALVPTVTLAVVFEASNTFDKVAQTLNVVQSLVLPFALAPCVHVAADRQLLGKFASPPALTWFASLVVVVVAAINGWTVVGYVQDNLGEGQGVTAALAFMLIVYYLVLLYFALGPDNVPGHLQRARTDGAKLLTWLRLNTRVRGDFESMLEVHH